MKTSLRTVISFFTSLLLAGAIQAQPESGPRETIDALFNAMRAGDSTVVRSVFIDHATMQSIVSGESGVQIQRGSIDQFAIAIGTPHDQIWDEQIYDVEVRIDGAMASVWAPYRFYVGDTFSHCGVNQFTLVESEKGWRILSIVDTRRKDC